MKLKYDRKLLNSEKKIILFIFYGEILLKYTLNSGIKHNIFLNKLLKMKYDNVI